MVPLRGIPAGSTPVELPHLRSALRNSVVYERSEWPDTHVGSIPLFFFGLPAEALAKAGIPGGNRTHIERLGNACSIR